MSEFNTGLPSIRQLQKYIKEEDEVEVKISTNDLIRGRIIWQDNDCLYLVDEEKQSIMVWRQALVYLKPKI